MLLGCIADDFTGAGDIASTLSREGMRTQLFIGIPGKTYLSSINCDTDAGVIALKSRSVPASNAVSESLRALEWLKANGSEQIVFKYCSTFDSTQHGNIGPVAEALADSLGVAGVVVCPSFPANGRTVYQGHLFVNGLLLSESGMEKHPLTPMTDADIRRCLQQQCTVRTGHADHSIVRSGVNAIRQSLKESADNGETLVVVDAICDEDLRAIGAAVADAKLVTGGSGIALGLPDNFRRRGQIDSDIEGFTARTGTGLVLSGSCSLATRAQVAEYSRNNPAHCLDIGKMLHGEPIIQRALEFIQSHEGDAPLIYSSAEPESVSAAQLKYGQERVATMTEDAFGTIAQEAVANGVCRLVVAGGETSGAVTKALGVKSFRVGLEIAPGVPMLESVEHDGRLMVALKSGNFGESDFFGKALLTLGGESD